MPPSPAPRPRRRRRRRWVRWALLVLLLVMTNVVLLHRPLLRRFLLPSIAEWLATPLGLQITIDDIKVVPGSVTLFGIEAAGGTPRSAVRSFSVGQLSVDVSLWGLMRGRTDWLKRVAVDKSRVTLNLDAEPLLPEFFPEEEEEEEEEDQGPPLRLPRIDWTDAAFELHYQDHTTHIEALDLHLAAGKGSLQVESWKTTLPTVGPLLLEQPLRAEFELAGGEHTSVQEIVVSRLDLGGRTYAKDVHVDLRDTSEVRVAGEFPLWGLTLLSCVITESSTALTVRLRGTELDALGAVFLQEGRPAGQLSGTARVEIPMAHPELWNVVADLELAEVEWAKYGVRASYLKAELTREASRVKEDQPVAVLLGEILALDVEIQGAPGFDLRSRFQRTETDKGALDRWEAVISRQDAQSGEELELDVSGVLHEDDLRLEAYLRAHHTLPATSIARWLPPEAPYAGSVDFTAIFDGVLTDPASYEGVAELVAKDILLPGADAPMILTATVSLADCGLRIETARYAWRDHEITFSLSAGLEPPLYVNVDQLSGRVADRRFRSRRDVVVEIEDSPEVGTHFVLHEAELELFGGRVSVSARGDTTGTFSASLSAHDLRLEAILGPLLAEVCPEGRISLETGIVLPGGGEAPPELSLSLRMEKGAFTFDEIRWDEIGLEVDVRAGADRIHVESLLSSRGGDSLHVEAVLPVGWEALPESFDRVPIDARFDGHILDLEASSIARSLGGKISGEITLSGRVTGLISRPEVIASCVLVDGALDLGGDAPKFSEVVAEIELGRDAVILHHLSARVRRSRYDVVAVAGGTIGISFPATGKPFRLGELDLEFTADRALLLRTRDLRVRGNVALRLRGALDRLALTGEVEVVRAYCFKNVELTPGKGSGLPLELFSFREAPLRDLQLDVRLSSRRGITFRNNVLKTQLSCGLRLGGSGFEPVLAGTVWTDEGDVFFGRAKLAIEGALVEFVADDPLNPRLQIMLGDRVRGYDITVAVTGTLNEPEVLLDSSPPLERAQLVVLLTTGLTADQLGEDLDRVAAIEAAKFLGYRLAAFFGTGDPTEESVFDRVSVETEGAEASYYEDLIRVEYRLLEDVWFQDDELFIQGERDRYGDYNFNFGVRFRWGS